MTPEVGRVQQPSGKSMAPIVSIRALEILDSGGTPTVEVEVRLEDGGWSIEDPLAESDQEGWQLLTRRLGAKVLLVGDDLFVTDPARIRRGVADGVANAAVIKPNQIGTLSDTLEAIAAARSAGYASVVSRRAGDTIDDFIAELAVGAAAGLIKSGAPARGERVAKYNQLLRIEEEIGPGAVYAGVAAFRRRRP